MDDRVAASNVGTTPSVQLGAERWRAARQGEHFVQLYEDDEALIASVRDYVLMAMADDAYAIVVATHGHIDALLQCWRDAGADPVAWLAQDRLLLLDAEQTLDTFMEGTTPRLDRFMATVGKAVAEGAKRKARVIAFGEMVALLRNRGLADAAIRVERFWNLLASEYSLTLFCAYRTDPDTHAAKAGAFYRICHLHDSPIAAETTVQRLETAEISIARLHERSRELEKEVARQQEAEEGLARLAAIVASSDDAIVSKTLQGEVRSWNAGAQRIFGYRSEEIVGKPITTIIPPELQHEEETILRRIRNGERIDHFETIRVAKDGRRIAVSLTVSPVRNARGDIIGASKIARDISERRAADQALRTSQRALAAEAESLARLNEWSSRLWRCRDISAGLNEMLAAVIEMLGADKGYVRLIERGDGGSKLITAAHRGFDSAPDFLDDIARTDAVPCLRVLTRRECLVIADIEAPVDAGSDIDSLRACMERLASRAVVAIPLVDPDDVEQGAVCVYFRDPRQPSAQDLRRLDLYARQASDFIQRCEIERTLRRNEETLRESDRRKDEFLAMLAHELRNPLAPIRFAAATNRRSSSASGHQRADAIIERQVQHMSRLLDDLLDVSRVTRGKIRLHRGIIDFGDVIAAALETARPALDAKHHEFALAVPPGPLQVDGDSVRLAQIFSNLLINAAKYTPSRGRIGLRAEVAANVITVCINDNGIGIEAEMMPRLFTLFAQARSNTSVAEGGLGIGLALVRALVELHGGSVEAKSDGPGKGSEFSVRLPIVVLPTRPDAYPDVRQPIR